MNQEQNNLNPNNFNTQGNNGILSNQPLQNNQGFNPAFNQNAVPNTNVNQPVFNPQPPVEPISPVQPQSMPSFQQPVMQEPASQPVNPVESGNANNQNFNSKPPKKKNLGLIIGIASAVIIAIVAMVLILPNLSKDNNQNNDSNNSSNKDIVYDINLNDVKEIQKGVLAPPITEFDSYTYIDGIYYQITINKGNWLIPKAIATVSDETKLTMYAMDSNKNLNEIIINFEKEDKDSLKFEENPYIGQKIDEINGWQIYHHKDADLYYMFYRVTNNYIIYIKDLVKPDGIDNEEYKRFYTKISKSIFAKQTDKKEFAHLMLPDSFKIINLDNTVSLNLNNYYLQGWAVSNDNNNKNIENIITIEDKDFLYQIIEFKQDTLLNECIDNDSYRYEEYEFKGRKIYLVKAIGSLFIEKDTFNGFIIEINNKYYMISLADIGEIITMENMDNYLNTFTFIEFN